MSMIMGDLETSRHLASEQAPTEPTPTQSFSRSGSSSTELVFGDVTAKDIYLNGNAGTSISLSQGSGNVNVNLTAQITGRCGNGCPSCIKAVKLDWRVASASRRSLGLVR